MYDKLYDYIEHYISRGVPPHLVSNELVQSGWPEPLVNQAVETWMKTHGRAKEKATPFRTWLKKYHKKARPAVGIVVAINLLVVAVSLLKPWPTKILADSVFGNVVAPGPLAEYTNTSTLIMITSVMTISLFVVGAILGVFRDFLLLKIGFWLNLAIKEESLNHIMHLPLYHQERLSKGDYVYRQNVVTNSLSELVLGTTSSIIESTIVIIGVLVIMLSFNGFLTLLTVILIPLLYLTMRFIGPKMGYYARQLTEVASETSSRINESVDNAETVQAFTLENKLLTQIKKLWHRGYFLTRKNMIWGETLAGINGFMIVTATSIVMYVGATAALRGDMTLGELLIFMVYMGYLLDPVENMVEQITSRNQKMIDVQRIYEVLSDHEGIENLRSDRALPPNIQGQIQLQNVTYSYDNNIVFENLNLLIPPGQKIGVIGPSGGGKSTLLKLIPLFIEPDNGRILMDGIDIQTVSLQDLRKHVSWVSQSPQLFDGSIIDNLLDADADRQITDKEIMDAIQVSNVSEFALHLPLGLASPAGENGGSLSGGQRQRIAIARALLRSAPVLCLDEPTAALDAKSENYIRDSLEQIIQGKTVMMVTHRRSLLALMDIIYVLDGGTLVDVNQLGGLDDYLAKLEGIELDKAAEEIQKEQLQGVNPEFLIDQYEEVMREKELTIDQLEEMHSKNMPVQRPPQKQMITGPAIEVSHQNKTQSDEVSIDLREK